MVNFDDTVDNGRGFLVIFKAFDLFCLLIHILVKIYIYLFIYYVFVDSQRYS